MILQRQGLHLLMQPSAEKNVWFGMTLEALFDYGNVLTRKNWLKISQYILSGEIVAKNIFCDFWKWQILRAEKIGLPSSSSFWKRSCALTASGPVVFSLKRKSKCLRLADKIQKVYIIIIIILQ